VEPSLPGLHTQAHRRRASQGGKEASLTVASPPSFALEPCPFRPRFGVPVAKAHSQYFVTALGLEGGTLKDGPWSISDLDIRPFLLCTLDILLSPEKPT
jgi:hypothetical protein